ncbi:hypothetical protein [Haladaptatus cibarius]|uniref:hypothetical protein n=1 Tax=Haladaptatus cibarius TaxID=453847 RepID=UPI001184E4B0|nr:hypothetical protein [Haladaptatus cibarius]
MVVAGAIFLEFGLTLTNRLPSFENPTVLVVVSLTYGTGIGMILTGATNFINTRKHGKTVAYAVLLVSLLWFAVVFLTKTDGQYLGTDGILFSQYSVDLLLSGKNPYMHSMRPAFENYPINNRFMTYRTDGSTVASLSYPALSFLLFVPQALLGIPNLNLTAIVVLVLTLAFLVRESPASLALAPFAVVFTDPNVTLFSFGGVFDILWVLPILFSMKYWHRENYAVAAIFAGLAFSVKQTPWFIGPFLAVWLYMESESYRAFALRARTCLIYGFAAFLLPNLPFILWNPKGWVRGTLTPITAGGAPLVKQGVGLSLLSTTGTYVLPKSFFTFLLLLVLIAGLALYALYFGQIKWIAWMAPAFVLLLNYRSLQNYFIFYVPIAYYAALLQLDATESTPIPLIKRMTTDITNTNHSNSKSKARHSEEVDDA